MKLNMRMFQRPNGYYYYEFERNKVRSLKTKDKREAVRLYNILKREYLNRRLVQLDTGKNITLKQFREKFFREHTNIADKTREAYELAFKLLIDFAGGSSLLSRIDEKKIKEFKSYSLARDIKKVSINTYLRHIKGILNKAYAWGDIQQKVTIEMFKLSKRHPRILTNAERKKF